MTRPDSPSQPDHPWIEIHDEEWSSEMLAAELERRVALRRSELGPLKQLVFPTFGHMSTMPQPPPPGIGYNPNLYYYLKQANQPPPQSVEAVLAPSPSTRVPVLGRLWQLIRGQMHELILFYVNRAVSSQNRLNTDVVSALNELTRVSQAQQAEIERLNDELQRLKA